METQEIIQTAKWSPPESAKQRGARAMQVYVFPDRQSSQKGSDWVVVSKMANGRHVFSVRKSELSKSA